MFSLAAASLDTSLYTQLQISGRTPSGLSASTVCFVSSVNELDINGLIPDFIKDAPATYSGPAMALKLSTQGFIKEWRFRNFLKCSFDTFFVGAFEFPILLLCGWT